MGKKIKICGKQRTLTFGLLAIETYCEKMGGDIEQLDKIFTSSDLEQVRAFSTLVWAALVSSCELLGEDLDFTLNRVKQDVGEMDAASVSVIVEEFKKSRYLGRTIADYYYTPVEQEATGSKTKKLSK